MGKVKNENYIVITGWMVNELQLKGNDLLIYALIYGFSQDYEQRFNGSLQYIADWTNSTKAGVSKSLKRLVEKGVIAKEERKVNGVKFCEYYATKFNGGMQQSCMGYATKFNGGMQQSLTNNINIYNTNNTTRDIKIDKSAPTKHKYGEFKHVLLTDEERDRLFKDKGEELTLKAIKKLDEYIEETGKRYKNHNLTLRRWVFDAVNEKKAPKAFENEMDEWRNA